MFEQVLDKNPDTAKIVFKHFPLAFHKYAQPAALAAIAAQKQGKFWEFHDLLFENVNAISYVKITDIAQQLRLDMAKFANDMKDPATGQRLTSDMKNGQKAGVTGTPTIFINGRRLKERTVDAMQKMIDAEMAKINNKSQ